MARPAPGAALVALLVCGFLGPSAAALLRLARGSTSAAAGSPVERVVTLLKDFQARLEKDGEQEQQSYDKFACWCEKTTARKAGAIEQARTDLRATGQLILSTKGQVATLASEIQETTADLKANEEAQQEATSIRQTENAAYQAESAELKQAIAALEKAITVLKDATQSSALLQRGQAAAKAEVQRTLAAAVAAAPVRVVASLPAAQVSLLQGLAASLAQGRANYAPQSATIQGLLGSMYDTFSSSLETSTNEEATKNKNFEAFIATKQEEQITLQGLLRKKEAEKAEAELLLAEATQRYDDTEQQMHADVAFFDATKESCEAKSAEWQERKSLRTEELAGIQKALDILTSDEARELFAKSVTPGVAASFVQLEARRGSGAGTQAQAAPQRRAYDALKAQATRTHSLRLARLAASVRTAAVGHFEKVISAIDTMVQTLKDEEASDIAKRDQCKEEYQKVASTSADLSWKIEVNGATIAKLASLIEQLEADKAQTVEDIATVIQQIQTMTDQRTAENAVFLQTKADDETALGLLSDAQAALSAFYEAHAGALLQVRKGQKGHQGPEFEVSPDQAPETKFSAADKRGGEAKGIVSILEALVENLKSQMAAAVRDEASAQAEYEKQKAAAEALQASLEEKKTNLEEAIAQRKEDKSEEEGLLAQNQNDLSSQVSYKANIQPDCDWIIGAFEERRSKRKAEQEGLTQAKAFLAGQKGGALMQGGTAHFDDTALDRIDFARLQPARAAPTHPLV